MVEYYIVIITILVTYLEAVVICLIPQSRTLNSNFNNLSDI